MRGTTGAWQDFDLEHNQYILTGINEWARIQEVFPSFSYFMQTLRCSIRDSSVTLLIQMNSSSIIQQINFKTNRNAPIVQTEDLSYNWAIRVKCEN